MLYFGSENNAGIKIPQPYYERTENGRWDFQCPPCGAHQSGITSESYSNTDRKPCRPDSSASPTYFTCAKTPHVLSESPIAEDQSRDLRLNTSVTRSIHKRRVYNYKTMRGICDALGESDNLSDLIRTPGHQSLVSEIFTECPRGSWSIVWSFLSAKTLSVQIPSLWSFFNPPS